MQHFYVSKQSSSSGMFQMEHSWCMKDVPESKDDVHKQFWVQQWICLKKYMQFYT